MIALGSVGAGITASIFSLPASGYFWLQVFEPRQGAALEIQQNRDNFVEMLVGCTTVISASATICHALATYNIPSSRDHFELAALTMSAALPTFEFIFTVLYAVGVKGQLQFKLLSETWIRHTAMCSVSIIPLVGLHRFLSAYLSK